MVLRKRGGIVSVETKVENDVNTMSAEELALMSSSGTLQSQVKLVETMKGKFLPVQMEVIRQQSDPVRKAHEEKGLSDFLQRCDVLLQKLEDIMQQYPPDEVDQDRDGASEQANLSGFLQEFLTKTDDHYKRQLDKLVDALSNTQTASTANRNAPIKLPQIVLPKFDGKYSDWNSFRDRFKSAIIDRPNTAPVDKLGYLLSTVTGDAASTIKHLTPTDANFEVAWKLLTERFERKNEIVADHVRAFYNMPRVSPSTPRAIHQIHNTFCESLMALDAMDVSQRDPWVIQFVLDRLDSESKVLWGRECGKEVPTTEKFKAFLIQRCIDDDNNSQSSSSKSSTASSSRPQFHKSQPSKKNATALTLSGTSNCRCCNDTVHPLYRCPKFLSQSADERFETVKTLKLCRNCLASHMTTSCTYHKCRKCQSKHNVLLHDKFVPPPESSDDPKPPQPKADPPPTPSTVAISSVPDGRTSQPPRVFLATAMVDILNAKQERIQCRMALDSGAQICVMTTNLYQKLNLPKLPANLSVVGVGAQVSTIRYRVQATIISQWTGESFAFDCYVMPKITGNIPNWGVDESLLRIPHGKELADPQWARSRPVDLLLSGDPYWASWLNETIRLGPGMPQLKETVFGYVVVGEHRSIAPSSDAFSNLTVTSLDETLRKFWEVENLPDEAPISDEQKAAEIHFATTHTRNPEGRFVVQLPFKKDAPILGSSRPQAIRQFLALERQFERRPAMKALYHDVMDDYLSKGWIEPASGRSFDNSKTYYMPHHGVLKESSITTKLRVVYNASAKTSTGVSLNDVLMIGPTVQPNLATILLRFRLHPVALTADISKMYLQLVLDENHADFQRLIWRKNKEDPLRDYRIPRVCFGVASSPFLATRALIQLADEHKESHPLAAAALRESFYVDDCVVSTISIEKDKQIQVELVEVLRSAGFVLTKWMSNTEFLTPLHSSESSGDSVILKDFITSVLGLSWNSNLDVFLFQSPISLSEVVKSKRDVASAIAKLFDPIGLVGPVIIEAKILLQGLNKIKLSWDASLPVEFHEQWKKFVNHLQEIDRISIPRWISTITTPSRVDLHIFCDASARAYGAATYIVSRDNFGNVCSRLLISKSRVAPLTELTIPRLELCGALLAAEMINNVRPLINPDGLHYWTDSSIVLSWLNTPPDAYKVFVARRITRILEITKVTQWRHVPTKDNPADVISRGCTPSQLAESELWWKGPRWLTLDESSWPCIFTPVPNPREEIECLLTTLPEPAWHETWIANYSSIPTIKHVMAYILRYINNSSPGVMKLSGFLTVRESESALHVLIRLDQTYHFPGAKDHIARGTLSRSQWRCLAPLTPFVDNKGLIRVGGRLQHSPEPFASKHPLLLPKSNFTQLLMKHMHEKQLHPGPSLLLAMFRQYYWPLSGRNLARKIFHECVTCAKAKPAFTQQLMGSLPAHRVTFSRAFESTGVDFAGPILIRSNLIRNVSSRRQPNIKCYIAIFICMATKAVHIEAVSALSTDAFLAAFRRFTSRRGTPRHMYSDRGRNFEGAVNELTRLLAQENQQRSLQSQTEDTGVVWHFNPPSAPHHGGLWEASVKSVKFHLVRVTNHSVLTFEELSTVLCQIEAVLNNRPVCRMSENPNDGEYLTPGHFLTGASLNHLPDPDLSGIAENRLSKWQQCQTRTQAFARKWRLEYLNTLQTRSKWRDCQKNVQTGEVVLLLDEMQREGRKWILGRIERTHPGQDGLVRVVTVRTAKGSYRRPVTKIARLPIPHPEEDNPGSEHFIAPTHPTTMCEGQYCNPAKFSKSPK